MDASYSFQKERIPDGTAISQLPSPTFQPTFLQVKYHVQLILMLQRKPQPKLLSFISQN